MLARPILLLCLAGTPVVAGAAAELPATGVARGPAMNVIALSPPVGNIPRQRAFTVTLRLDFSADPTLGGAVDVLWNPADVQLEQWLPSPVGDPQAFSPGTALAGALDDVAFADPAGVAGPAALGTLTFRALGAGPVQIDVLPDPASGSFVSALTGQLQPVQFGGATIDVGPPFPADEGDTDWRHVAVVNPLGGCPVDPGSGCPEALGWNVQRLFEPSPGDAMPPALDPFCVYEVPAPPGPVQLAALNALVPGGCVNALQPDSLVVTYMGQAQIEPLLWPPLRDDFLDQAGKPDEPVMPGGAGVRLAIVDTQPDGLVPPGNSRHGHSLRGMARELLCNGGPCGVGIVTPLGLPMLRCDTDPREVCRDDALGGYMATVSQLAAAIRLAVVDWLETAPGDRLVMNLSVAWHPRHGDDPGDGPAFEAVFKALEDAACRGALVIAAAGNAINEPTVFPPADPLLPGGWETFPAPDEIDCTAALEAPPDPADFPPGPGEYRPLLHAAGAVAADDARVASRVLGEPRLVAFGDHAVVQADDGSGPTQVQTGTSVAALVVSAAAAAAWSQEPAAPAFVAMRPVYDAGRPLGREAEFFNAGCPVCETEVRRVSVCAALERACDFFSGAPCAVSCEDAPPGPRPLPIDTLQGQFVPAASVDVGELSEALAPPPEVCGDYSVRYRADDFPVLPCPQFQFWGIQAVPYASGQPSSQPCEVCAARVLGGDVYLDVVPDFTGTLSDVTLSCSSEAFRLPVPPGFGAGDAYLVTGVPAPCTPARLAYGVTEPGEPGPAVSVSTALLLDYPDADRDTVADESDNCLGAPNVVQLDTDGDDIGNACDPDIAPQTNDCLINFADLGALKSVFFTAEGQPEFDPDADLTGDGLINFGDLGVMKAYFFQAPGPSGVPGNLCAGGS